MIKSKSPVSETIGQSESAGPGEAIKRRGWLLGLGAAGAAAVVAKALPVAPVSEAAVIAEVADPVALAAEPGGYQLSPHVLRYYETARS